MALSQSVKDLILGLMGGDPIHQAEIVDGIESGSGSAQNPATENLDLASHKIVNSADPTSPQDLATKAYVDASPSGTISSLTGDVTGTGPGAAPTTVAFVGASSASLVHSAELLANAATSANTVSAIVKRDSSGNFSAGTITANLTGNASGTSASVTGIVTAAHGGTGLATLTANNVILGNGTGNALFVAPGTSGNLLTSDGTTWTSAAAAASGANTTLSNLTNTIAINKDFIFDTGSDTSIYTKDVGSGSTKNLTVRSGSTDGNAAGGSLNLFSGTTSSGNSGAINLNSGSAGGNSGSGAVNITTGSSTGTGSSGTVNINTGTANTNRITGSINISTANSAGGSGTSGSVTIGTGTSSGARGKIKFTDGSEGTSGYLWTSTDTLGNGAWTVNPSVLKAGDTMTGTLNVRASTTSASTSPIKIPVGVLMTTPETGAIEFDGTNLYITIGGSRKTIVVV